MREFSDKLSDFAPRDTDEQYAAAVAVRESRRLEEWDELVDALTVRERLLIEETWTAAVKSVRDKLSAALRNPQAVTLDAAAVQRTVQLWNDDVRVVEPPNWTKLPGVHHDPRVVAVVRRATQEADEIARQADQ